MAKRVKIQQGSNNQIIVTIPSALAQAMGFEKGKEAFWVANGSKSLILSLEE